MNPRFLVYLSLLFVVLIYAAINYKHLSLSFKLLNLLILITLMSESMTWSGPFSIQNPLILYHILLPLTMLILWFISRNLTSSIHKINFVITVTFILLSISNSIWYQNDVFPSHGVSLLCNLGVWLALGIFKDIILLPSKIKITKRAEFWFAVFSLIFYSTTFFTFTFYNFFSKSYWLQDFSFYSNFILYPGYCIAFYFDINRNKYTYEH